MSIRYTETQERQIREFKELLPRMSEEELKTATEQYIWLSAYASNNPHSAFHPICDATYDEWARRGNLDGYSRAHKRVSKSI